MKRIIAIAILAFIVLMFASCAGNVSSYISSEYKTAIIKYPNGEVITIEIETWSHTGGDNNVTIKCVDGTVYRTAWQNVLLIGDTEE